MKNIRRLIIFACLMGAFIAPSDAQLGNIGNRIKNEAKRKVRKEIRDQEREAEKKIKEKIEDKVSASTNQGRNASASGKTSSGSFNDQYPILLPNKSYSPSAEAKKKVAQASNSSVMSGYTKSKEAIFGGFEALNPEFFPYAPYYNFPILYPLDLEKDLANYSSTYWNIVGPVAQLEDRRAQVTITDYIPVQLKGEEVCIPICESFMNAFAAVYATDPQSINGYVNFMKVCHTMKKFELTDMSLSVDPSSLVVNKEKNILMLETGQNWYNRWSNIVFHLGNLATSELSLADHTKAVEYLTYKAQESADQGKIINAIFYFEQAELALEHLKNKREYDPSQRSINILLSTIKDLESDSKKWREKASMTGGTPIDMPKTYNLDAKSLAELTKLGKAEFGSSFVKAVFLSNSWKTFKRHEWPYDVLHRSVSAGIIYKEGNEYYLAPYDFQQKGNGSTWQNIYNIVVPMKNGSHKKIKNYKP